MPVSLPRAFDFTANGRALYRANTLRQFVTGLESLPRAAVAGHVQRGDFSRWIGHVYGDRALADDLAALERQHRGAPRDEIAAELANAVRARYDLDAGELQPAPQ